MKAGCEKNLRFLSRSQELLTFLQSHCRLFPIFESGCFLTPKQKKNCIQTLLKTCSVIIHRFYRNPTNSERRFAPILCLRLRRTIRKSWASVKLPRIFCISCSHAGYAKKGACLARMIGKRMSYSW